MKIATFNVNGVNARLPVLLRWLEEAKPDVACLQELKAAQEKFPADALHEAGYRAIWHGQKAWNGVAIIARTAEPIETGRRLAGDPEVKDGFAKLGVIAVASTPDQFRGFIRQEMDKYAKLIKEANIKVNP